MSLARPSKPASEAWVMMVELVLEARRAWPARIQDLGLVPNQAQALRLLDAEAPMAMSELASTMDLDNSSVTAIVRRLERAGLVERRPAPRDRRVRALVLTADGVRMRGEVERRLATPPTALAGLQAAEARELRDLLARAIGD